MAEKKTEKNRAINKLKNKIKKQMLSIGTYRVEYEDTILIFAEILQNLYEISAKFEADGCQYVVEHTNKNGSTNVAKNPTYQIIENLRISAKQYANELGLTPAGLKRINDSIAKEQGKSILAKVVDSIESSLE